MSRNPLTFFSGLLVPMVLVSCFYPPIYRKNFDAEIAESIGFPMNETFITNRDMQIISVVGMPSNKALVVDGGPVGSKVLAHIKPGTQVKSLRAGLIEGPFGQSYFYLVRIESGEYAGWTVAINHLIYPYGFFYKRETDFRESNKLIPILGMDPLTLN